MDTFIAIYIANNDAYRNTSFATSELGAKFFMEKFTIKEITKYERFFIPILTSSHFTLVYLDCNKKEFYYIDPMGKYHTGEERFAIFEEKTNQRDWTLKKMDHDNQSDTYNCGVFICQFVECILKNKSLLNLEDPNTYRTYIKKLLTENSDDKRSFCLHCGLDCDSNIVMCNSCGRSCCYGCKEYVYEDTANDVFICELCP